MQIELEFFLVNMITLLPLFIYDYRYRYRYNETITIIVKRLITLCIIWIFPIFLSLSFFFVI